MKKIHIMNCIKNFGKWLVKMQPTFIVICILYSIYKITEISYLADSKNNANNQIVAKLEHIQKTLDEFNKTISSKYSYENSDKHKNDKKVRNK